MMTIGQAMRTAGLKAKISQAKLGALAGISPTQLCDYERDRRSPGIFNLIELADALGLTIDEYIGRKVKEEKDNG